MERTVPKYNNENDVKKQIKVLLARHGYYHWPTMQTGMGTVGASDRLAIKRGVFLAVEAKFGKRKLTSNQAQFLEAINAEDAFGFVVSEKSIDHLQTFLETFDRMAEAASKGQKPAPEDGSSNLEAIRLLTEPIVEAIQKDDFAASGGKHIPAA